MRYCNSFITDWKIGNEHKVLKTKVYYLEHNFGHGKRHFSLLLATMYLLAFGMHALLELADESYRLIRAAGSGLAAGSFSIWRR